MWPEGSQDSRIATTSGRDRVTGGVVPENGGSGWIGRFPRVSTGIYLAMGWLIVVAAVPTIRALSPSILFWLFLGGMAYTVGTYFYHNERIPFAHAIWHLFVLAGSVSHAVAVGIQVSGG